MPLPPRPQDPRERGRLQTLADRRFDEQVEHHQPGALACAGGHRDIKPSNVLVEHQENQAVHNVIDFGLAKALGNQLSDATMLTNLSGIVGTLQYMSPEQAEPGKQDVDTRTDVCSLGALLYVETTPCSP